MLVLAHTNWVSVKGRGAYKTNHMFDLLKKKKKKQLTETNKKNKLLKDIQGLRG